MPGPVQPVVSRMKPATADAPINAESHSAGSQYIGSKQIISPTLTVVASMDVLPVCCLASKISASKTHLRFGVTLARHVTVIACSLSPSFENL